MTSYRKKSVVAARIPDSSTGMSKASEHLHAIKAQLSGSTTLGALVKKMGAQGFGLLIFILSAPFIQPIPTGGLSAALGSLIALLAGQRFLGRSYIWLPQWIEKTPIDEKAARLFISSAEKCFRFLEKFIHPRMSAFCRGKKLMASGIFVMALVMMLPIPIPFSNTVCAIPLALWAIAIVEDDGLLSALAYLLAVASLILHLGIFYVIIFFGYEALPLAWEKFTAIL